MKVITTLVFASILVAVIAVPTHASDATDNSSDDVLIVPSFIPGFDDLDPAPVCPQTPTPNLVDFNGCGGTLRLLPWNTLPTPTEADRIRFLSPLAM